MLPCVRTGKTLPYAKSLASRAPQNAQRTQRDAERSTKAHSTATANAVRVPNKGQRAAQVPSLREIEERQNQANQTESIRSTQA